ncbi:hypothetical protein, partial [Chromatium okenii]|uniref:hypothetical protein n=1 Tax=Chromatium okenii TaxID=61644 RepID=UPI0026F0492B
IEEKPMNTLNDLMHFYPGLTLSGSENGMDRYEVEAGVYACVCPDCGYIVTEANNGCGNCGYGAVLYGYADTSIYAAI